MIAPEVQPTVRNLRVLLVEDNPADERLLRAHLGQNTRGAGFALTWVRSLQAARTCLQDQLFDACLLDLGLPDAMGVESVRALHVAAPEMAVVVLTGDDAPEVGPRALGAGAQDVLVKGHLDGLAIGRALGHAVERHRADAEIRSLNAQLEARVRERTEALGLANEQLEALVHTAYHEMKAPLRSLSGLLALLGAESGAELTESSQGLLERAVRAVERMDAHIDALQRLALLVHARVVRRRLDLAALARARFERLSAAAPRPEGHRIWFRAPSRLPAEGDPDLLQGALDHLLDNALKFSAPRPEAHVELGVLADAEPPVYFLRDDGVGFDTAFSDKLFRPFQRLHRADEFAGLGIGLACAQRIVRLHGGEMWAEAEPGRGACFFFTLGPTHASRP